MSVKALKRNQARSHAQGTNRYVTTTEGEVKKWKGEEVVVGKRPGGRQTPLLDWTCKSYTSVVFGIERKAGKEWDREGIGQIGATTFIGGGHHAR